LEKRPVSQALHAGGDSRTKAQQRTEEYSLIKNPNNPRNMFTKSCTNVPDTANTPCTLEKMVLRMEVKMSRMDCSRLLIEERIPVMIAF